jgi:hypothetical protein
VSASLHLSSYAVADFPVLRQLLANLWTRSVALQCCFNQETTDCFIPTYTGPITADTILDPAAMSGIIVQIKYKTAADTKAGNALRPIGIPRDLCRPPPYLALLLELGNESLHQETRSKIKITIPAPARDGEFSKLTDNWLAAVKDLEQYRIQEKKMAEKKEVEKKMAVIEKARLAMDSYNRYAIFVRGASPDVYGILKQAEIAEEFKTLLSVTMPSPTAQDSAIQHMRPLERLGHTSGHTAWMSKYVVKALGDNEEEGEIEGSEMDTM